MIGPDGETGGKGPQLWQTTTLDHKPLHNPPVDVQVTALKPVDFPENEIAQVEDEVIGGREALGRTPPTGRVKVGSLICFCTARHSEPDEKDVAGDGALSGELDPLEPSSSVSPKVCPSLSGRSDSDSILCQPTS